MNAAREEALTVAEAAELLRVSPDHIKRAIRSTGAAGQPVPLPAKLVGRGYRIRASALWDWFDMQETA
jgi:excisionase family DNA binding protein